MRSDLILAAILAATLVASSAALAGDPPALPPADGGAALAARTVESLTAPEARALALAWLTEGGDPEARVAALTARFPEDAELAAIAANLDAMAAAGLRPTEAMIRARGAFRAIDRLARDHPDDPGVRLQRGMGALRAPTVAGRDAVALAEFDALLSDAFTLDPALRAFVEARRAEALAKLEGRAP